MTARRAPSLRIAVAALCLAAACSRGDEGGGGRPDRGAASPDDAATSSTERGAIAPTSLPATGTCEGTSEVRGEPTFVTDGKLFSAKVDGTELRCLADVGDVEAGATFEWARTGTKALLADRLVDGARATAIAGLTGRAVEISDPTGRSVLSITDTGRLLKMEPGGAPVDISFLATTTEAVYHPAGRHIAASGKAADGSTAIWIARSDGTDAKPAVPDETAETFSSLGWTSGGLLTFVADHGNEAHVHLFDVEKGLSALPDDRREPQLVVPSAYEPNKVAVTDGPCGRQTIRVATWAKGASPATAQHVSLGAVLGKLPTEPVGWLADGTLLLIVRSSGCTGPGSLWAWHPERREVEIAKGVLTAAVRGKLPAPPAPPFVVPSDAATE